ncbi:methyl-accepting chemotaxis protein [Ideonella sp. A 288]|uniref:methyl-accepting chemotaxis protein n=1 Tax=Ideonella sp. A 288 TaxID=1962181 RepID=UPI000B4A5EED|nr:methyl-accepting chemotaxis protein [Ideonella sp. A 288]
MTWFDDLSLKFKLALAPAVCLALLGIAAGGAVWGFARQQLALEALHANRLPGYAFSARFESGLRDMNGLINRSIGYEAMGFNAKEVGEVDRQLLAKAVELKGAIAERQTTTADEEEQRALDSLSQAFGRYDKSVKETLEMKSAGAAIAATFLSTAQKEYDTLLKDIARVSQGKLDEAAKDVASAGAAARWAQGAIAIASACAFALGIAMTLLVARGLARRIGTLSASAATLAAGDLSRGLQPQGRDEVGRLMTDLEAVRLRLAGSIQTVHQAAESVRIASAEIAAGNADLSQRTEQQAGSLQQTATSMEELSATVRQNADTALRANQLAGSASAVAREGGEVVGQVVQTMEGITHASRRIADIIGTIDGIAFQTNILALNAAVEAARAGEQGRGFAVVAGEVRTLAQRSAAAAREIKTLIGDSTDKVEAGSRLVKQAGTTMDHIVAQVRHVGDMIGEISAASVEQTTGIGEVSSAVTQLDHATQRNAALVEQSAAAAESLKEQSQRLVQAVGAFTL